MFFVHIKFSWDRNERFVQATENRAYLTKKNYVLDQTKRRSLQPDNVAIAPKGYKELTGLDFPKPPTEAVRQLSKQHSPPLETNFIHDFFGSQLIVDDFRIGGQLARKRHRLEIIGNQVFIDNIVQDVNAGELEKIKAAIRRTRI